jgi:hypothetical protein
MILLLGVPLLAGTTIFKPHTPSIHCARQVYASLLPRPYVLRQRGGAMMTSERDMDVANTGLQPSDCTSQNTADDDAGNFSLAQQEKTEARQSQTVQPDEESVSSSAGGGEIAGGRPPTAETADYSSYSLRVETFRSFPTERLFPLTAERLAEAGFIHQPDQASAGRSKHDRCVCTSCGLSLYHWQRMDDPALEHLRHFYARKSASSASAQSGEGGAWCEHLDGYSDRVERYMQDALAPFTSALLGSRSKRYWFRWPHQLCVNLCPVEPGQAHDAVAAAAGAPHRPQHVQTLNRALRSTGYRTSLRALLEGGRHSLDVELRVASFQEVHLEGVNASQEVQVCGFIWLQPASCGTFRHLTCRNPAPLLGHDATRVRSRRRDEALRATISVWGGPWLLEHCRILSVQCTAASKLGVLKYDTSRISGTKVLDMPGRGGGSVGKPCGAGASLTVAPRRHACKHRDACFLGGVRAG